MIGRGVIGRGVNPWRLFREWRERRRAERVAEAIDKTLRCVRFASDWGETDALLDVDGWSRDDVRDIIGALRADRFEVVQHCDDPITLHVSWKDRGNR